MSNKSVLFIVAIAAATLALGWALEAPRKAVQVVLGTSWSTPTGPIKRPPTGFLESGRASYYWQPQALASGGRFNPYADPATCAHRKAKFNTILIVTNKINGLSVACKVNDRGPYVKGRIVDLNVTGARKIGMLKSGVVPVTIRHP